MEDCEDTCHDNKSNTTCKGANAETTIGIRNAQSDHLLANLTSLAQEINTAAYWRDAVAGQDLHVLERGEEQEVQSVVSVNYHDLQQDLAEHGSVKSSSPCVANTAVLMDGMACIAELG